MSIRPVDMQIIIPKAAEANSANNNATRAEQQQQHNFAQQLNKQVEHESRSIIQSQKSEKEDNINKDGRNSQDQSKRGRRNRGQNNEENEDKKTSGALSLFDIRI